MFKHHGKAPRPMLTWSGPWSTLMMLHEIEYFQCKLLNERVVTALNDKYDTQVTSYDSLVITILEIFILSTIIFLGHVLILLFPRPPPCRCCCAIRCSVGFSEQSHQGECQGTKPASKLELRNKWHRLRFRLCDRHWSRQSDPHVVAKNVNVNLFEFSMTHLWLSRVYSYLRQLSGPPTERFCSPTSMGKKIRRHGMLVSCGENKPKERGSDKKRTEGSYPSSRSKTSLRPSLLQPSLLFSSTSQEKSYNLSPINTTLNLPTMTGVQSNPTMPLTTSTCHPSYTPS